MTRIRTVIPILTNLHLALVTTAWAFAQQSQNAYVSPSSRHAARKSLPGLNAPREVARPSPASQRFFRSSVVRPAVRLSTSAGNKQPPSSAVRPAPIHLDPNDDDALRESANPEVLIPPDFVPWWQGSLLRPLRRSPSPTGIDSNMLLIETLRHSARVRAISENMVIAETAITRADAEFDVHAFMESKFVRTSVPTGSTLDAGFNVPRLRERDWNYRAGMRRKNQYGGRFELAQQIGLRDSNSNFFFPDDQGNSRLTLSYNQPLLNGAGKAYNSSLIVLANLDSRIAADRTAAELQDHLLAVTEAMWDLYLHRSLLLQKERHLDSAKVIFERLVKRRHIDSLDNQIARAGAAVAIRRAEMIRASANIRNAEARTRALVNSPDMLANRNSELIPARPPTAQFGPMSLKDSLVSALKNRPEIDMVSQEIQAGQVRLNVAVKELLPVLDVVLETYVSGLRGDNEIGRSWTDQFSVGEPSYTAGLVFEVPLYRRAARVNHQRRQAELRKLFSRFQAILEDVHAEVEIAVREVETSFLELQANYQSMVAEETNVKYLHRHWETLPGDDRAASFILEDLLEAQDRRALTEFYFVRSQVNYTMSRTRLNRTTGTLLQHEQIQTVRGCEFRVPTVRFEKMEIAEALPPPQNQ